MRRVAVFKLTPEISYPNYQVQRTGDIVESIDLSSVIWDEVFHKIKKHTRLVGEREETDRTGSILNIRGKVVVDTIGVGAETKDQFAFKDLDDLIYYDNNMYLIVLEKDVKQTKIILRNADLEGNYYLFSSVLEMHNQLTSDQIERLMNEYGVDTQKQLLSQISMVGRWKWLFEGIMSRREFYNFYEQHNVDDDYGQENNARELFNFTRFNVMK